MGEKLDYQANRSFVSLNCLDLEILLKFLIGSYLRVIYTDIYTEIFST